MNGHHVDAASCNLRKALHFARYCPSQVSAVLAYARKAGEHAAYSGLAYVCWFKHQAIAQSSDIRDAFVDAWYSTCEALADVPLSN